MSFKITRHLLSGNNVDYLPTRGKDSGPFAENLPDTIIIHYTAGASLDSSVQTLRDGNVQASAHVVVGRDGKTVQLIPFNRIAWHAGRSTWGDRKGLNKYSIGIEIDNAGRLKKVGDTYQTWWGGTKSEKEVMPGIHRNETRLSYWHTFKEEQISIVKDLCFTLKDKYNIQEILGHEEIAPHRKSDPGPAFPLDKIRQLIFENRGADEGELTPEEESEWEDKPGVTGIVTASLLNVRTAPGLNSGIKRDPLPKNTRVEIVGQEGNWYKVKVYDIGWVSKDYIRTVEM